MELLYPRCCGLDVHKSSITACVLLAEAGKQLKHIRRFGCTTRDFMKWLHGCISFALNKCRWSRQVFIGNPCGTLSSSLSNRGGERAAHQGASWAATDAFTIRITALLIGYPR